MWINKEQFLDNFQVFDKEIVLEIIDLFISEYPERMQNIWEAIQREDMDKLRFHAHSVKGVIANYCAPDLQEKAKELEYKAKAGDRQGLPELFEAFRVGTAEFLEELKILREHYR